MKTLIVISILLTASVAQAQVVCQPLADGRIVCTPAGGGSSIYGR